MRSTAAIAFGLATLRSAAGGRMRGMILRLAILAALAVVALLALLAAAGSGLAAFWLWLLPLMGPVKTALIVAAGLVAIALLLLVVAWLICRRKPRRQIPLVDAALQWIKKLSSGDKDATLLLGAVLAGFAAGLQSGRPAREKPRGEAASRDGADGTR
jgi:hypothetical protein